jgi:hypothetical protein
MVSKNLGEIATNFLANENDYLKPKFAKFFGEMPQ